jgi:tRNA pseudouridine55 synthase
VDSKPFVPQGILLVDKPAGRTSFSVVACVRKKTAQPTVGHAGTLDPFATGLLVVLLGKLWTKQSNAFLNHDKEYEAVLRLGLATDSYDRDGVVVQTSSIIPTQTEIEQCLSLFQGSYSQTPPMFSAKKVDGKRLYELARKGISIEREQNVVHIATTLIRYSYPELALHIRCSKGTYIRSIAHDLGNRLGCLAYVHELVRTRSGPFCLSNAVPYGIVESLTPDSTQPLLSRSE